MRVSTKVRYGTRMLIEIAAHRSDTPLALREIANRQEVSLNYAKHILGPLVAAGFVRTERGSRGGVVLARPPEDITLSAVVGAIQGTTAPTACVDDASTCPRSPDCVTRDVWCRVHRAVEDVLAGTTIADLVQHKRQCTPPIEQEPAPDPSRLNRASGASADSPL